MKDTFSAFLAAVAKTDSNFPNVETDGVTFWTQQASSTDPTAIYCWARPAGDSGALGAAEDEGGDVDDIIDFMFEDLERIYRNGCEELADWEAVRRHHETSSLDLGR
jgi:hypothetical protein